MDHAKGEIRNQNGLKGAIFPKKKLLQAALDSPSENKLLDRNEQGVKKNEKGGADPTYGLCSALEARREMKKLQIVKSGEQIDGHPFHKYNKRKHGDAVEERLPGGLPPSLHRKSVKF